MKLVIGYLYPKIMNIYGDRGNILALVRRTRARNIETEVHELEVGNKIPEKINLFFFGGGQDKEQLLAAKDLQGEKTKRLQAFFEDDCPGLFICGGYQLMGHSYQPYEGLELAGAGILDIKTIAGKKRLIGNLLVKVNDNLNLGSLKTLVGFENHSGKTFLGEGVAPLGKVLIGNGNNGQDKTEGAVYKNVFGCYLHGPVLPKNPHFADYLIKKALEYQSKESVSLKPLDDQLELETHRAAIKITYQNT